MFEGIFGSKKAEDTKKSFKEVGESNSFEVKVINDDQSLCHYELGITEKRLDELQDICLEVLKSESEKGKVVVMSIISTKVKHVNELYMCFLITEGMIMQASITSGKDSLLELLKNAAKRNKGGE